MHCACVVLSSVTCPVQQYFYTLSHKRNDFRKKKSDWTWNVCYDFLYNFVWNIFHSKKNWARYDQKWLLVLMSDSNKSWTIWTDFQKYLYIKFNGNSAGAELFHADRRTDIDEANSSFPQFCECTYKWTTCWSATPNSNATVISINTGAGKR